MKIFARSVPLLAAAALLWGCQTFREGVPQEVVVLSDPSGASVYVNGDGAGVTPLEMELPRKLVHEIRLEKEGYNAAVNYFAPEANEKSKALIRFGLMQDLGYYYDLQPSTMETELKSEMAPESLGSDPYESLAQRALAADAKLEAGEITPEEHRKIIEQILQFYEENL